MHNREWLLQRNCSLSPRQLACFYAALCTTSFSLAFLCALHGAWYVLGFSLLEMAAVALAFLHYARHATDCEQIILQDDCLLIERVIGGRHQQIRLDLLGTRVMPPCQYEDLIGLQARGVSVDIGRFVTQARRRQVAAELRWALQNGAYLPTAA